MKKVIFVLVITTLIGSKYSDLFAQKMETKLKWIEKHPIDFSIGNFSVGMPFSKILIDRFYPLTKLGTEFYYRNRRNSQILQTAKLGGYYSKHNTSAFFVNTEIVYRYTFNFGLFADANLGVGYSHLFHPNAIFKSNENGEYEQIRDWGKPSMMANYLFSIGYNCSKRLKKNTSIFLCYGNYIQLFYNADIPALPQNSCQLGVRFLINQNQNFE
jgi:hypothetical protein